MQNPYLPIPHQSAITQNKDAEGGIFIPGLVEVFFAHKGVFGTNVTEGVLVVLVIDWLPDGACRMRLPFFPISRQSHVYLLFETTRPSHAKDSL